MNFPHYPNNRKTAVEVYAELTELITELRTKGREILKTLSTDLCPDDATSEVDGEIEEAETFRENIVIEFGLGILECG